MRNLLLALLLANALYMLWGNFLRDDSEPGVVVLGERDLGPPLLPERTCVTIGPFLGKDDAAAVEMRYASESMPTALRQESGPIFVGHWVQVRDIATREAGAAAVRELHDGGIPEAYLVATDDEGLKISLGLFDDLDSARRLEQRAQSLGLPADISRRMSNGVFYVVDVALPPGRGTGAMVERYGEERVLMRGEAACPQA